MKVSLINLTAVNVSEISDKTTSATFHKILTFVRIYQLR